MVPRGIVRGVCFGISGGMREHLVLEVVGMVFINVMIVCSIRRRHPLLCFCGRSSDEGAN